ncbi:MAG: hypothetical protein WD801_06980 [Gemmatimonadaceae bacterium]
MDRQDNSGRNSSGARQSQAARLTRMRLMHRKSQGLVAVYEQDPADTGEAGGQTLVFETPSRCVRVAGYPPEWQRLSDDELVALQRRSG